jgi:hypothetical protein
MDVSTLFGRRRKMRDASGSRRLVGASDPYADILVNARDLSRQYAALLEILICDSIEGEFWILREEPITVCGFIRDFDLRLDRRRVLDATRRTYYCDIRGGEISIFSFRNLLQYASRRQSVLPDRESPATQRSPLSCPWLQRQAGTPNPILWPRSLM